jgi:hypothetical protein
MLSNMLNLTTVQVRRITEDSDGMGGLTTATTITTLSRANIWQPGSNNALISDKIAAVSTHVLALEYGEYSFTDADQEVIYDGVTYRVTGRADNVANRNELVIVGLELIT